jgi:hypothetical protein
VKTVECYKAGALDKLKLRSRADIVRHALVEKWFNEDDDPEGGRKKVEIGAASSMSNRGRTL